MEGLSYGTKTAADALFGQFEGDSGNGEVLEMLGSCLTTLLRLVLTGM